MNFGMFEMDLFSKVALISEFLKESLPEGPDTAHKQQFIAECFVKALDIVDLEE
jgi:hypothetical protein